MEKRIENPKVFISYAWGSKEYQEKVMALAERLQYDGVEVLIDKWIMKPGSDTIDFMEQCVKDSGVNFVLILLDKNYSEKADKKTGGVGIETQIISNEVYKDVKQEKFIPIIFERDSEGNVSKPIYLKSRLHYDLTSENFEDEYVKLVKQIYGRDMYYKPIKGNKPSWIDDDNLADSKMKFIISQGSQDKELLKILITEIKEIDKESFDGKLSDEDLLQKYNSFKKYRNILIDIYLKQDSNVNFIDDVCEFYDEIKKWNIQNNELLKEIVNAFIHETFVYLIAVLFKNRNYKNICILIKKSYFLKKGRTEIVNSNNYFYDHNYGMIDAAKKNIDKQNYYSSVAQLWIENLYEPKIGKEEFVTADLLIYNMSILLLEKQGWYWFPICYVYGSSFSHSGYLGDISIKLKSKYELSKMQDMFGVQSVEEIKKLFDKMKEYMQVNKREHRYLSAFETADIFLDTVKIEEIGSVY